MSAAPPPRRSDAPPLLELRDLRVTFHVEGGVARAVDGIDVFFVGAADLAQSMGFPGDKNAPE
ncbi:MAG: hypothetical protein Q7J79_12275, partial [Gemmatimonadales bacterium]|nr:hypothetical protein [Gemmatimonadales bacterium]